MEYRSYKFRIYPTKEQKQKLAQFFGAKRWIFNHFLHENKQRFLNQENHLSVYDVNNIITELKKQPDTSWLKQVDDWCLKHASEDLGNAYQQFFNSLKGKRKGPKVQAPTFKNKHSRQSYRTRGVKINIDSGTVFLPKLKNVKCVLHREFTGNIKSATVSKDPSDKYYVSILVEEETKLLPSTKREVGIDLGLKDLCILSNGVKFQHPEIMLAKAKLALKKQQKKLSRKTKGSKNYEKQRIRVARVYEKITWIRNWYYHNISSYLVQRFDAIYMENLNVSGMLKNRKLSRKIHETAWSTLVSMINYKAASAGRTFHQIGQFVPSSKTCSCCGHKLQSLDLGTREWTCPSCGTHHDRDLNAAINIKNFGQLDCYDQILPSQETGEVGEVPMSLQKFTTKIERSPYVVGVGKGSEKATKSLVSW